MPGIDCPIVRIQETLETTYKGIGGLYYSRDKAWDYIKEKTDIDLLKVLQDIANE